MNTTPSKTSVKVFGIGGAGCNALNALAPENSFGATLIAVNTDSQSLASCAAAIKFSLGAKTTFGLGAGGDPEIGHAAAESDFENLRELCADAKIVFVLSGLGGGTGTGASSVVARAAKESGALVLGVVTTPFEFEGGRRQRQAQLGLQQLKSVADAVICLPNQKLFKLIDEKTTVSETFHTANRLLAQGVSGIFRLLTQTGLINVDFADLSAVTRNLQSDSAFATVEATGESRGQEIAGKLFSHPMLDEGELLEDSDSVLVSIVGGADLAMAEVNLIMREINNHCKHAHVIFGAAIDDAFASRLSVTVIASGKKENEEKTSGSAILRSAPAAVSSNASQQLLNREPASRPPSRVVAPAPELTEERKEQLLTRQGGRPRKNVSRMRQRELPLEIISKGRFEKSEPTIHHGEDLDLPTYIRRGIALN